MPGVMQTSMVTRDLSFWIWSNPDRGLEEFNNLKLIEGARVVDFYNFGISINPYFYYGY